MTKKQTPPASAPAKRRTLQDVEQDYWSHAQQAGHKSWMLQHQLPQEIQDHHREMTRLQEEAKLFPRTPAAPAVTQENA